MNYRFPPEFMKSDIGFWILNKYQTYIIVGATGMMLPILTALGAGIILRIVLAVFLGVTLGFLVGGKYKGVYGFMYVWQWIYFQFNRFVLYRNSKGMVLYAAQYPIQSTNEKEDENLYESMQIQPSLPKSL